MKDWERCGDAGAPVVECGVVEREPVEPAGDGGGRWELFCCDDELAVIDNEEEVRCTLPACASETLLLSSTAPPWDPPS